MELIGVIGILKKVKSGQGGALSLPKRGWKDEQTQ